MNINMTNRVNEEYSQVVRDTVTRLRSLNDFMIDSMIVDKEDRDKVQQDAIAKKEAKIRAKLEMGIPLTGKEMDFLRKYCPQLYAIAVRVQLKRKILEEKLSHAKSKEEVQDIQLEAMATIRKEDPAKRYMIATVNKTMEEFKETLVCKRLPEKKEDAKKNAKDADFHVEVPDEEKGAYEIEYQYEKGVGAYQIAYVPNYSNYIKDL